MKFKLWIVLLFAASGHGFLRRILKKSQDLIDGSHQDPTDGKIEEHQDKTWATQQSASSNHGSYGNSAKDNFEHPGEVHHEYFDESNSEVHSASSGGNSKLELNLNANISLNSHRKISKAVESVKNLGTELYNGAKNKRGQVLEYIWDKRHKISAEGNIAAQSELQSNLQSHYAGSYGGNAYGGTVTAGQDLNNETSAAHSDYSSSKEVGGSYNHGGYQINLQQYSDLDSNGYQGYNSKSTGFTKDSSSEGFDEKYQNEDQKLFNSDTSKAQGHELGLLFGLKHENSQGSGSYHHDGRYQSENQQLKELTKLNDGKSAAHSVYNSFKGVGGSYGHGGYQLKLQQSSNLNADGYQGDNLKSTGFTKDSSSEGFDEKYQNEDQKLFNSDTSKSQGHELGLLFGLEHENSQGSGSYRHDGEYQSGNQQLGSSYTSGYHGYGSKVQSNLGQGHPDGKAEEHLVEKLEPSKASNSDGFYEHNQNQYSGSEDQNYETFPQNDYSQSQSLEEPKWPGQLQHNGFVYHTVGLNTNLQNLGHSISHQSQELRDNGQLNSQTHGLNTANIYQSNESKNVNNDQFHISGSKSFESSSHPTNGNLEGGNFGLMSSYSAHVKESGSGNDGGSNFVHQSMHSGISESSKRESTGNSAEYGMNSDSAHYQQNKNLAFGFNAGLIGRQEQDHENSIELQRGSSELSGHMPEENFAGVHVENSAINQQSHEQFGKSSAQIDQSLHHGANSKADIGSYAKGKLSHAVEVGKSIGEKVVHGVHAVRAVGKGVLNSALAKVKGGISNVANGANNIKASANVGSLRHLEKSGGYDATAAAEHESSYGDHAHSSETGYENQEGSKGFSEYEQHEAAGKHQVQLASGTYSQSKTSAGLGTSSESGSGHSSFHPLGIIKDKVSSLKNLSTGVNIHAGVSFNHTVTKHE